MRGKRAVPKVKSLRFRLMIVPMFATFLLGAILMLTLVIIYQRRMESEYLHKGITVTQTVADLVSGEMIDRYLSSLEKDNEYEMTLLQLRALCNINDLKYIYVTRITKDGQVFAFDSDEEAPVELGGYVSWSDSLGEGEGHDEYTTALSQGRRVEPLIARTLNWGWVLSVYEPIFRADGTVAGFAGVDISMDQVLRERMYIFTVFGVLIGLIFVVAAAVNLFAAQRYVISPVNVLVKKAASFLPDTAASEDADPGQPDIFDKNIFDQSVLDKKISDKSISDKRIADDSVFKPELRSRDELAILERSLFDMELRVRQAISELQKAQESERKASEAKTVFLANMSHELRTPMNTILNMTRQVIHTNVVNANAASSNAVNPAATAAGRSEMLARLNQILASSQELLSVINIILEISNIENRELVLAEAPLRLGEIFHDIALIVAPQCAVAKLRWLPETGDADDVTVSADRLRLTQVLAMLLRNAVKYTAEPGCIRLSVKPFGETEQDVNLFFEISCTNAEISARDSEELTALFDSSEGAVQSDYKRVLSSVCRNLVQAMGGRIEIHNNPNAGLFFSFTLHFRKAEMPGDPKGIQSQEIQEEDPCEADFSGKQIMVVDDVAVNRMIVTSLLCETGAEFTEAKDGREALALFLAEPEKFDAILMDITMPNMDGYEATRKIREAEAKSAEAERPGHIPIIALTAHTYREDVEAARKAGMDFHLGKPVEPEMLVDALKNYLTV